jgi:hypothetical protein
LTHFDIAHSLNLSKYWKYPHQEKKLKKIKKTKTTIISKDASNIKRFSRETFTSSRNIYILTAFALGRA